MNIEKGINYCKDNQIFERLNAVYESVPTGKCKGCTKCCHESVNISVVEGLNIISHYYMGADGKLELPEGLIKKLLQHQFLEWVKPQKCPFLNENSRCDIYEARPLPCRIFGNRTFEAYQKNLDQVRKQNINAARYVLKEMGLKIPKSVINRTIEYCEHYQRQQVLNTEDVNEMYDVLVNLDGRLYFEAIMNEMDLNQHLVGFFIENILIDDAFETITSDFIYNLKLDVLKGINLNKPL